MGSDKARPDEAPRRSIQLSPFYMDTTPVYYDEYKVYVRQGGPKTPYWRYDSYNQPQHPVTGVSWNDAVCFCNWKSEVWGLEPAYELTADVDRWGHRVWQLRPQSNGFRLPSEAQWEYAARGGQEGKLYPWGDLFDPQKANYDEERGFRTGVRWWRLARVQEQWKNGFGLYGMSGNVWQWTQDWYRERYDINLSERDPIAEHRSSRKSLRGGSWGTVDVADLRVSRRSYAAPFHYNYDIGWRTVLPVSGYLALARNLTGKERDSQSVVLQRPPHRYSQFYQNHCSVAVATPKRSQQPMFFDESFVARLGSYLADLFPESLYFQKKIDQQEVLTPLELARIVRDVAVEHGVNPVFLVGIMASESGLGTVSFPRWFNNPMAYHWANWKMKNGAPMYDKPLRGRNRRYRNLAEGFAAYSKGIRRLLYYRAAKKDFYAFHHVYVGYEALEWMQTIARVYRDLLGTDILSQGKDAPIGGYIYLDWKQLVKKYNL